jgi:hypothetical protein
MLSQSWNGGGAERFSDEGYVADSVGEEKFRRLVTEVGFGVETVLCETEMGRM